MEEYKIELLLNCNTCYGSKPDDVSYYDYAKMQVAKTKDGLIVWCNRCDILVTYFPYDWSKIPSLQAPSCACCKDNKVR